MWSLEWDSAEMLLGTSGLSQMAFSPLPGGYSRMEPEVRPAQDLPVPTHWFQSKNEVRLPHGSSGCPDSWTDFIVACPWGRFWVKPTAESIDRGKPVGLPDAGGPHSASEEPTGQKGWVREGSARLTLLAGPPIFPAFSCSSGFNPPSFWTETAPGLPGCPACDFRPWDASVSITA